MPSILAPRREKKGQADVYEFQASKGYNVKLFPKKQTKEPPSPPSPSQQGLS